RPLLVRLYLRVVATLLGAFLKRGQRCSKILGCLGELILSVLFSLGGFLGLGHGLGQFADPQSPFGQAQVINDGRVILAVLLPRQRLQVLQRFGVILLRAVDQRQRQAVAG